MSLLNILINMQTAECCPTESIIEGHRRLEGRYCKAYGMDFKLKDFRPTCAQMIKDRNKGPVELATKQLRHSGPDTTYRSYAQIRSDTANEELNNLFIEENVASIYPDRKTFLIPGEN